ncbi:hypothetical protein N7532_009323 [Penicillium argentinense]|uniref:LPXTG-domain-containing protein n=1 Tax=Penicillium argentinense TaxID=1131581 RepID=A0A9W9EZB0_9EURO|nr:uncharacterized protein N7532_009323 [Penicillium argentinense]KAJ5090639.1 hypothetical protein N7532_009323 [Penicillium argentinense]
MPGLFSRSATLALFLSAVPVSALRTTSGSPCADVCGSSNTTASEIACLDSQYNQTKGGAFEKCVSCQLESTYTDRTSGETDVNWGLYNLRYAVSSCIFGYPAQTSNLSSPCPVSCDGVRAAVETDLKNPSADNFNSWCGVSTFADNVVNSCEFCYNLTASQNQAQVYLANFLESIRYNCHFEAVTGSAFDIAPSRIFTSVLLPSSMSLTTSTSSSSGVNLGLVIALPVLGFVIILIGLGTCCFFFIRYRRKRTRRGRHQNHMWNVQQRSWAAEEMNAMGLGRGDGFGFVDYGRGHQAGYGYSDQYPLSDYTASMKGPGQEIREDEPMQSPPIPGAYSMHGGMQGFEPDQKRPL